MIKAKCRQNPANGLWYCTRMGVTGKGSTPEAAFLDMKKLYADFIRECQRKQAEICVTRMRA